jgi:hypothetical protein
MQVVALGIVIYHSRQMDDERMRSTLYRVYHKTLAGNCVVLIHPFILQFDKRNYLDCDLFIDCTANKVSSSILRNSFKIMI